MHRRSTKRNQYECMVDRLQPAQYIEEEKQDIKQQKEEFLRIAQASFYDKIPDELKEKEDNLESDEARYATLIRMAAKVAAGNYVIKKK